MKVGIYIYENAEVLDFSGPFEVFSTANRFTDSHSEIEVFLVAEHLLSVKARGGFNVNPSYSFNDHPDIDLLIIPGGIHTNELTKMDVINWITSVSKKAKNVASVCTGAFLLAEANLLSGLNVTTHWEDINDLKMSYPTLTIVEHVRWVDEGKFVSSAGISAGIDMSLHLVSKLFNTTLAEKTAKQMDFEWRKNS